MLAKSKIVARWPGKRPRFAPVAFRGTAAAPPTGVGVVATEALTFARTTKCTKCKQSARNTRNGILDDLFRGFRAVFGFVHFVFGFGGR
jgi:hypothetical protein